MKFVTSRAITDTGITLHTKEDFSGMRAAGKLAAQTLNFIEPYVKPGVSTLELNDLCHDFITKHGAIPAPLNYKGFPKSICTSINHVVCHGIPDSRQLVRGDIINIDVTVILNGWYGDTSRTFAVGKIGVQATKLIRAAHEAMMAGINAVRPGGKLGEVGYAIQRYAAKLGYSVVRDFCGHGIGLTFHTEPQVLNYGQPHQGVTLQPGMFFTVEPMLNVGSGEVTVLADEWTAVTQDRSLSAQFEHTIGVTEEGYEIFTLA